jgi:hypothetical protein
MEKLSDMEISNAINRTDMLSKKFLALAELPEYNSMNIWVGLKDTTDKTGVRMLASILNRESSQICREFFYKMSVYYTNQRIYFECLRDGINPSDSVGTFKRYLL